MKAFLLAALLLLTATVSRAQDPSESYERYLLPVATVHERPGSYGSVWDSDIFVRNNGSEDVLIPATWVGGCIASAPESCFWTRVQAQSTIRFDREILDSAAFLTDVAAFVYIPKSRDGDVEMSTRIRNISGDDSRRGTEIPVVPIREFRVESLTLLDVVVDSGSRTLLRIFYPPELASPSPSPPPQFRIRTFDLESDVPVEERIVGSGFGLHGPNLSGLTLQTYPGFAEWSPDSKESRRLRVVIDALDASIPFWAFSSTSDNLTQNVVISTPQPRRSVSP